MKAERKSKRDVLARRVRLKAPAPGLVDYEAFERCFRQLHNKVKKVYGKYTPSSSGKRASM